jgi:sec-independent protein translocase protein TatA
MSLGPWQLAIIAVLILVLFGRGRISEMMGDFGKGINSFKKGMSEAGDDNSTPAAPQTPPAQISPPEAAPAPAAETTPNSTASNGGQ